MSSNNMKNLIFKYLSFTNIEKDYKGISVFIDGKEVACGSSGDVLKALNSLEEGKSIPYYDIIATRVYFDIFVIELSSK